MIWQLVIEDSWIRETFKRWPRISGCLSRLWKYLWVYSNTKVSMSQRQSASQVEVSLVYLFIILTAKYTHCTRRWYNYCKLKC